MNLPKNYNRMLEWMKTSLGTYALEEEVMVINSIIGENILKDSSAQNIFIITEHSLASTKEFSLINRNAYKFILFPLNDMNLVNSISFVTQTMDCKTILIASSKDKLPIDSNSLDFVILPHSLENMLNPEEVLRESYRVLRPEGKIIITGFNLLGIWGLWRIVAKIFIKDSLWGSLYDNNFFFVGKLFKSLRLLGFKDLKAKDCCYNLPINNKKFLQRFDFLAKLNKFMPFIIGNVYVIYGCKKVVSFTPIKPCKWNEVIVSDEELAKNILKIHNYNYKL
jgi:SAM-dependent methyltransferase